MKPINRVRIQNEGTSSWEPHSTRPATTADLVAALIAEGGAVIETDIIQVQGGPLRVIEVGGSSGRYLVYRIPVESAEANGESPEVPT